MFSNIVPVFLLLVAGITTYVKVGDISTRVEKIESVRERVQAIESKQDFNDRRITGVEGDAKQSAILFGEFRSKLDVVGSQVSTIAEWVKQQQRLERVANNK